MITIKGLHFRGFEITILAIIIEILNYFDVRFTFTGCSFIGYNTKLNYKFIRELNDNFG